MYKCVVIGGGTFSKVACHLALAAPAFGSTARQLKRYIDALESPCVDTHMTLTKMADSNSDLITNEDVEGYIGKLLTDQSVKVIIMNVALCDFSMENPSEESRLSSLNNYKVELKGVSNKVINHVKQSRPDIFVVGFKTTHGNKPTEQCSKAFKLISESGADLVLANDVKTYNNILITKTLHVREGSREDLLQSISSIVVQYMEESKCYQYV